MNVRAEGEAIDVEGFRNLVVTYRNGAPVRLRDVAVVEDGLEDRRRLARTNGRARDRLRHHQAPGGERGAGGPRRAGEARRDREAAPRGALPRRQLRHHRVHRAGDQRDPLHPHPGRAAHQRRVLGLPRLLVHDPERPARHTHVDPRHVHRHVRVRLHPEHVHRPRPDPRGRHRGRRRDHGAREHLPPPRAGRGQGDGRLGGRPRDHLRRRRGDARDHGHLPARWPS